MAATRRAFVLDALPRDRTLVMGVVNVTPDSFSDGGSWFDADAAIAHGRQLIADGADILDIGGESTRPGATRVDPREELRRVLPVVRALSPHGVVSIDTTRASVADAAVNAGATIINDVSGGLGDPQMAAFVAHSQVAYVCMHWRGPSDVMDSMEDYTDIVADVRRELVERTTALRRAGVGAEQIIIDPGLGFAKAGARNWPVLAHLDALTALGYPVLVGASRKRFLGQLLAQTRGASHTAAPPTDRDRATAAVSALAAAAGAWAVRVHAVPESADAVRVAAAWNGARGTSDSTPGFTSRQDGPGQTHGSAGSS